MDYQTAIGVAARIWCDPDYPYVMSSDLAEKIARLLLEYANSDAAQPSPAQTPAPDAGRE